MYWYDLVGTCSMAEIAGLREGDIKDLKDVLVEAKVADYRVAIANASSEYPETKKMLQKTGFKEIAKYRGNHNSDISVMYLNLQHVKVPDEWKKENQSFSG